MHLLYLCVLWQYADSTQVVVAAGNTGAVSFTNSAFWGPSNQIAKVSNILMKERGRGRAGGRGEVGRKAGGGRGEVRGEGRREGGGGGGGGGGVHMYMYIHVGGREEGI